MKRPNRLAIVASVLYVLAVCGRLWLNQLVHIGAGGDAAAFQAAVWWLTVRDIAVLTALYGPVLLILLLRRRKG